MLRDYIEYEYEPVTLELMKSVKKLFDPHDIMNPGKKLPA
jgi:D-lactate dehydrogenase